VNWRVPIFWPLGVAGAVIEAGFRGGALDLRW